MHASANKRMAADPESTARAVLLPDLYEVNAVKEEPKIRTAG